MKFHLIRRSVSIAAAAIILANPVAAEGQSDPAQVLASVNGVEITLGHVITLRSGLPAQYDQLPAQVLFEGILDQLIRQTLLMQSIDGKSSRLSQLQIENESRAILAGQVVNGLMSNDLDEDALQAAYESKYADANEQTEYHAAHILVETIDKADGLAKELDEAPVGE